MKVQDNLENYEIPSKFRLSIEQEEELAKVVAEIIPELEKRRTSKMQTRKYFKQHLRYSSNVREDNADKGKKEDLYEEGESYTPLEGEYTWASDLLQPVLLDVLSVERLKYGYIINLLQDDIESRGTLNYGRTWSVPDNLVQFTNEFDIEAIREEVAKIEDIRKRIVFLQTKKADLQVTDLLSISEKQDWGPEFDDKIDALIKLEEKRLELYPSGFERPVHSIAPIEDNTRHADILAAAYSYKFNEEAIIPRFIGYMSKAAESTILTFEHAFIEEVFNDVENEFDRFVDECNIYEEDKIHYIFDCFDHWLLHFRELVDTSYSSFQKGIKKSLRRKADQTEIEAREKKGLVLARFIVEKANIIVARTKANIMYNHRYVSTPFYNINGGTLEQYRAEREEMEDKFGGGREKEILFDRDANISAFYEEILDTVRSGLIEASTESDQMDDEERMPTYMQLIQTSVNFDLPIYLEIAQDEEDISASIYHEVVSWVETTRYCISSVVLAVELWVASDEDRSILFDYPYFQEVNFDLLPAMFFKTLLEHKSDTGVMDIDDKLNDLGERDADEWDLVVPTFDTNLLTEDFITEKELDAALLGDEAESLEKRREKTLAAAEEALKQADKILNGPVEIVTYRNKEESVDNPPKEGLKHKACKLSFYDSVQPEHREIIYKYMHDHVGFQPGIDEYLYIKALIDENYLKYPTFTRFAAEFPAYKKKDRNFSHYFGSKGVLKEELSDLHQQKVDTYIKEINTLLGLPELE